MSSLNFEKLSLKKFKIDSILPDATILCLGRRRSGKCLAKDTSVLMYDGTIRLVQDIKKGDLVMGDDSRPRNVLGTTYGTDIMYKVTHDTGHTYTVNSEHVLSLKYTKNNYIEKLETVYRVHYFNKSLLQKDHVDFILSDHDKALQFLNEKNVNINVDIPIQKYIALPEIYKKDLHGYKVAVEFPAKELPFDPYIFGYWLGQHCQKKYTNYKIYEKYMCNRNNLIIKNSCILHYIANNLGKYNMYLELVDAKTYKYSILPCTEFDLLELDPTFIPDVYKYNSIENRLNVLSGFIDASGSNVLTNMYKDIIFLAESVGLKTQITENDSLEISDESKIKSKIKRVTENSDESKSEHVTNLCGISVVEQQPGEYYGFELDGNHRFVLGNFIVTHNSWLVRDMFFHHRHIPLGLLFSGTEEASPFFSDFIPDAFIHSEYDPSVVESVLNRQKRKIRESKLSAKSETGKTASNNIFIVLDDMLHDAQNWKREKTIKNIFFNGRHYNILFILTMQYPLGITPELRSNIDYVFVFNEPSLKNRRKIYDDYAGMIPSFDHFCNILDACTQDHECLVIKTSGNSNDLRDQVFWYKAEYHNNFKVGHPKLWEYHRINYNKDYEEEAENDHFAAEKLKKKFAKTKK